MNSVDWDTEQQRWEQQICACQCCPTFKWLICSWTLDVSLWVSSYNPQDLVFDTICGSCCLYTGLSMYLHPVMTSLHTQWVLNVSGGVSSAGFKWPTYTQGIHRMYPASLFTVHAPTAVLIIMMSKGLRHFFLDFCLLHIFAYLAIETTKNSTVKPWCDNFVLK